MFRGFSEKSPPILYDFTLKPNSQVSDDLYISIDDQVQGYGYGRKLVEAHESICRNVGINLIVVDLCTNPQFWQHMGYERFGFRKHLPKWRAMAEHIKPCKLYSNSHFKRIV